MKSGSIISARKRSPAGTVLAALCVVAGVLAAPSARPDQSPIELRGDSGGQATQAASFRPQLLRDVSLEQRLDNQVPLDLVFRDENGKTVALKQFFAGKPVILTLVYYQCPMLCTQVLNGLLRSLKDLTLVPGRQFEIVTVSIDPTETPVLADAKHILYAGLYGKPGALEGWHFLTGAEPQIKQLAEAVGYRYAYDPATKQFAHPAAIMVLTPEGRLSRYFYGISYSAADLRMGLVEASEGRIGTPVDHVLLYCFHYDPATGKYGLLISRVIQLMGALTALCLAGLMIYLFRHENYALDRKRAPIG